MQSVILFIATLGLGASVQVNVRSTVALRRRETPAETITQWVAPAADAKEPCVDCSDDGGAFKEQLDEAQVHVEETYSGGAPVVVTAAFCNTILEGIKSKSAPYWNEDERNCNEERPHVLAQCSTAVPEFMETIKGLCPNSGAHKTDGEPDFHKVPYVPKGDIPRTKDERKAEEDQAPLSPLGEGAEAFSGAAPGTPQWQNFPNAPSEDADTKLAQKQAVECDPAESGAPCNALVPDRNDPAPANPEFDSQYQQVVAEDKAARAIADQAAKAER